MYLQASRQLAADIERISYPGQPEKLRQYLGGYEHYFEGMPKLADDDPLLPSKITYSKGVMNLLARDLLTAPWIGMGMPESGDFNRTIVAMESPVEKDGKLKEGAEFVVAKWGDQFSSPVHGHAFGYMHEEVLFGKLRVNTYRIVDPFSPVVRFVSTVIAGPGTLVSKYMPLTASYFERPNLIHNFTSIGQSASLHYLPEHTRDGRDNKFIVEHYEDVWGLMANDVVPITSKDGMYLRKGDVVLVRSSNVPEYGDHYIVVTGAPVIKEHGLRPQDTAIGTKEKGNASLLLDLYDNGMGLTLLKLKDRNKKRFLRFHGIEIVNGEVVFPQA